MQLDLDNLPDTHEIDMVLIVTSYNMIHAQPARISVDDDEMVISEPVTVKFNIYKKDNIKSVAVGAMKAQIEKIRADSEVKCVALQDKINSLLAIEDKSDSGT